MRDIFAICFLLAAGPALAFEPAAVITGVAYAIDGDDVGFGKVAIRLRGIAAPENSRRSVQPGGPEAEHSLANLIDGKVVTCHLDGTTAGRGKRPVGVCFVGGINVNRHQVRTGHARDCPAFSGGVYGEAEAAARRNGADLSEIYRLPDYCT
jgi:endonuclease YncB( thermonuclease family)